MARPQSDNAAVEVVRAADEEGDPVIVLGGEIDLSNAEEAQSSIDRLIEDGTRHVIIDMATLTFLDSSGIAILVRLHNRIGAIEVRNPTPMVRRILEVTGLLDTFGITN